MASRPDRASTSTVERDTAVAQVAGGVLAGVGGVVVAVAVYVATSSWLLPVAALGACGVGFVLRRFDDYRPAATGWLAGFGVGLLVSALDRFA